MRVEQWQIDMARRQPPSIDAFVQGSTPVLSFGNALTAEVATIGINPSRREFDDGGWLTGAERRLATLDSLSAVDGSELTDVQARQIVEDCNRYFNADRNPYWTWFKPLDAVLGAACGVSYTDGSACHLDLVQWATDPVWAKLPDASEKVDLLTEGAPQLTKILSESNIRLVLANGKSVIDQVQKIGLVQWMTVESLPQGSTICTLQAGSSGGVRFLGWSTNLQSSFGVSREFRAALAAAVTRHIALAVPIEVDGDPDPEGAAGPIDLDSDGYLGSVIKVDGKLQFWQLLDRWYEQSTAPTVGDVANFGGRPAIVIDLGEHVVVLNADTKRGAVAGYLEDVRVRGVDAPWQVVKNSRGRINKVLFGDDIAGAAGWYAYLRVPLSRSASI